MTSITSTHILFVFWKFDCNVLVWVSLISSYLSLLNFLDVRIHQIREVSSRYFLKCSLCPFLILFSYWDSHDKYVCLLDSISQVPLALFTFLQFFFFFLFFKLDNFHCPISKFTDFFLLSAQIWFWFLLVNFSFLLLYFSAQNFFLAYL